MKTEVRVSLPFQKAAKAFFKKYPSFGMDLSLLEEQLIQFPYSGNALGNNCYKVRLKIKSKGRGKSGGARIITHVVIKSIKSENLTIVTLLTCYDKSEVETISEKELIELVKKV